MSKNSFFAYEILSNTGQAVGPLTSIEDQYTKINFPEERGLYYLRLNGKGISQVEKVIVY